MSSSVSVIDLQTPRNVSHRHGDASAPSTLLVENRSSQTWRQAPVTAGIPFARGARFDAGVLALFDHDGRRLPLQVRPLSRWSDHSIQWLLVDTIASDVPPGLSEWEIRPASSEDRSPSPSSTRMDIPFDESGNLRVILNGRPVGTLKFPLTTESGEAISPRWAKPVVEESGSVRTTLRIEGRLPGCRGMRCLVRLHSFAGTGLLRLEVRLHNPRRARHSGGLWDLGDPNRFEFQSFKVQWESPNQRKESPPLLGGRAIEPSVELAWSTSTTGALHRTENGSLVIEQFSSGGPNDSLPLHIDRNGRSTIHSHGFRVQSAEGESRGDRATPFVAVGQDDMLVSAAVPQFWQQFPKRLEAGSHGITVGLFPAGGSLHELQPGERKTHDVWFAVESADARAAVDLRWTESPPVVRLGAERYSEAKAPSIAVGDATDLNARFERFLAEATTGNLGIESRRNAADEYGWRDFGDLHADHEQEHFPENEPLVSHYNNQFDLIYGGILQHLRTGDPEWRELYAPLARHVMDIDLYHTDGDRAAYNHGLFWHTDHYRTAGICTHRSYGKRNARPGQPYGGGPSCEHNYTSGLLHYHYLTGDPEARDAVVSLAEWVLSMDDGRQSLLAIADSGPTGLATATADENYHGPGRGAGNSINALVDAWLLTRNHLYLNAAEALIRRVVHPQDDVDALGLLNAEMRWSYTVCLVALAKWLDVKAECGEIDDAYAYGQASLLHYGRWMLQNERPYFDRREELEYPTSAWAAQELRKANVLRLAARHAEEAERSRFLEKAESLSDRAWSDLESFDNRGNARCLSILMTEGTREAWLSEGAMVPAPRGDCPTSWPPPSAFVPQKQRVKNAMKSPAGALRLAIRLLNVLQWPGTIRRYLQFR